MLRFLRREYHMSATEAWCETPVWELDVLLGQPDEDDDEKPDEDSPVERAVSISEPPVPEALKGL